MISNSRQLDTYPKLATIFALFPVLSLGYAHTQLRSLYPLSTFGASHMSKNTRLFPHLYNFNVCVPECGSLGMRLVFRSHSKPCAQTQPMKEMVWWHKSLNSWACIINTALRYHWLLSNCGVNSRIRALCPTRSFRSWIGPGNEYWLFSVLILQKLFSIDWLRAVVLTG